MNNQAQAPEIFASGFLGSDVYFPGQTDGEFRVSVSTATPMLYSASDCPIIEAASA